MAEGKKKAKGSKPSAAPNHPPYFQMIKEAIQVLKEKTGSSAYAIAKHMEEKHEGVLPSNFRKILAIQLKNFAAKGKLVKVKASFKLSDSVKKENKKLVTVDASAKKKGSEMKKPVVKKAKRASPAKAKQPKSIKSAGGKRARKAAA